jgi:hypothetical protein
MRQSNRPDNELQQMRALFGKSCWNTVQLLGTCRRRRQTLSFLAACQRLGMEVRKLGTMADLDCRKRRRRLNKLTAAESPSKYCSSLVLHCLSTLEPYRGFNIQGRNGSQVRSGTAVESAFRGGLERGSPRIDSARAREALELAMSRAPPLCQRVIRARPCSPAHVTNVMSTISLRSPITDEAACQSRSSLRAPSSFKFPANSNRKAVGPSCI